MDVSTMLILLYAYSSSTLPGQLILRFTRLANQLALSERHTT